MKINKVLEPLNLPAASIPADAQKDIALINQFTIEPQTPENIYAYNLILCGNEVDRDGEAFNEKALTELQSLMVGKPGILNHDWYDAKENHSRIYRTYIEKLPRSTSYGTPLTILRASAYTVITDKTREIVDKLKSGVIDKVSIGCRTKNKTCSICGAQMRFSWDTWTDVCCGDTPHTKGQVYDGKQCFTVLDGAADAYEYSFVSVPAQTVAGVTKSAETEPELLKMLQKCDPHQASQEVLNAIKSFIANASATDAETHKRNQIKQQAIALLQKMKG